MSELEKGCHRSHPHEEMDEICRLKAELAKVAAERDKLESFVALLAGPSLPLQEEIIKLKTQLATAKAEGVYTPWLKVLHGVLPC